MARNRKRAKERRARRPQPAQVSRPGVATARSELEDAPARPELEEAPARPELEEAPARPELEEAPARPEPDEAPNPLEHATPDVELADAQLAVGRGERTETSGTEAEPEAAEVEEEPADFEQEADDDQEAYDELDAEAVGATAGRSSPGEVARLDTDRAAAEPRHVPGNRLVHFLQGSWRELQRVQWPDRRQVMQATGVVIGFVIVAGVFLGVADALAGKLMNLILK